MSVEQDGNIKRKTTTMFYCEGSCCSRKDRCEHHFNSGQYIDQSTQGMCIADTHHQEFEYFCGDRANAYNCFKPRTQNQTQIGRYSNNVSGNFVIGSLSPKTISIKCDRIILKQKGIEIEITIDSLANTLKETNTIVINGVEFAKTKSDNEQCSDYSSKKLNSKWIYHECVSSYDGAKSGYSCSHCNAFVDEDIFDTDEFHKDFCGNCGAKMKGETR